MDAPPLIQVIVASTRDGRRGERVAAWFEGIARERGDMRCEIVDLLAWDLPWYRDAVVPPRGAYTAEATLRWASGRSTTDAPPLPWTGGQPPASPAPGRAPVTR